MNLEFRANRVESFAEFEQFRTQAQPVLDDRYRYENSLASAEDLFTLEGTCGACLRPSVFTAATAGGQTLQGNRRVPNWRETLRCDCAHPLVSRQRAVLHFLRAKAGLYEWTRAAFFGPAERLGQPVTADVRDCRILPSLVRVADATHQPQLRLQEEDQARHLVVSLDYLHRVPPLETALREICRILTPGGRFIFTVPFHVNSESTSSSTAHLPRTMGLLPAEFGSSVHDIGWNILPALREAGFSEASAHLYWSEELGYFGPYNFIFSATR